MTDAGKYSFALCLSHDVDRLYKTYQYPYRAVTQRDPAELLGLLSPKNPYWQFERIMAIESRLGVRSAFNILDEITLRDRPKSEWLTKSGWMLYAGGYDITDQTVASTLELLDTLGWEIALQGSYTSSENPARFGYEKQRIESVSGAELLGNRQHHWRLSPPETWQHLEEHGIKYDTSLGSSERMEFQHGHELIRPFDDDFVVFPWSLMDAAVMNSADNEREVWANARDVLETTKEQRGVLVADWHQRVFYDDEFPGWGDVYRRLIETAQDMGAWVGTPGEFYEATSHPDGTVSETLATLAEADD